MKKQKLLKFILSSCGYSVRNLIPSARRKDKGQKSIKSGVHIKYIKEVRKENKAKYNKKGS